MWMSSRRTHEHSYFLIFSYDSKERLAAMRGTAHGRHTDLQCALSRHKAPGSLSQGSNPQESLSPDSACRRVVPWGDVSSWSRSSMNLHTARPDIHHTSLRMSGKNGPCMVSLSKPVHGELAEPRSVPSVQEVSLGTGDSKFKLSRKRRFRRPRRHSKLDKRQMHS
jgi:hypothetical protein